jgi:predicted DNA-binding transcriptional regulator AlpA
MHSENALSPARAPTASPSQPVVLSPWVNERFPDWEQILSTRDVARLTRRPRWILRGLALFGRFPRQRRYHGRGIGWLRSDVIDWLAKDLQVVSFRSTRDLHRRAPMLKQASLPFKRDGAVVWHSTKSRRRRIRSRRVSTRP